MNHLQSPPKSQPNNRSPIVDSQSISPPKLDEIVKLICADARKDALKYALRSDTGHDGE